MRVERTEDVGLIYLILATPGISEWIGDDGGELNLVINPKIYYLLAKIEIGVEPGMIEEKVVGCMAFGPINGITWNPHLAILPQYRGHGTQALQAGIDWMFKNSPCEKLVAYPPSYNFAMVRVFEKCGFVHEGYSPDSVRKNGLLHGRHLMGRNR